MTPLRALWIATAAFGAGFAALAELRHRFYWAGRFDLGNLTQTVWSTAHGDLLELTDTQGRQISRLGAHFDPLVAAFAPLWWLWPDPSLLLVVQAVAVALGAPAVYLLGRRHLACDWAALGVALAYLLFPATQWLVLADFHPVALATPLLLWGFWFLDTDRLAAFGAVALAACLTKEQIGLVVAAMGIWYAARTRRWRVGLVVAALGTLISAVAVGLVIPHFAPTGVSPFAGRYAEVGGSAGGILRTAVTDPGTIGSAITGARDGTFLLSLLAPLLFLPLLAPLTLAVALPEVLLDLLSSTKTQTSIHFQYTAGAIPALVVATIFGLARLERRRTGTGTRATRVLVAASLVAAVALGPIPRLPLDRAGYDHARAADRILRLIPPSAPVSATNTLGAHLSERRRVFSFPVLREARWVVVDTTRPSAIDRAHDPARFARALAALRARPRTTLVASEDGILLFRLQPG